MNQKEPIYRTCDIICPNCCLHSKVTYVLDEYIANKGYLSVCDNQLFYYYDESLYNEEIIIELSGIEGYEDILFRCATCGEESNFDYVVTTSKVLDIVQRHDYIKSFRPLLSYCDHCATYSTVNVECDITLNQVGYICRDEQQQYVLFRCTTEESDVSNIVLSYDCCGEEIDNDKTKELILEDRMIHSVEAVDIFADFWPPPPPPVPPAELLNRFDLLDI